MSNQQLFLGAGSKKKTYVNDVFSNDLYIGNTSASQSVNNGIDLSANGGMVWTKGRENSYKPRIYDTNRGTNNSLRTSTDQGEETSWGHITAFNNNGFTIGTHNDVSYNGQKHNSWTFRKAQGWFDVVTYSGNGSSNRNISHNLGCVPGMIFVKRRQGNSWQVYHMGSHPSTPRSQRLYLNEDSARSDGKWESTDPTSTHFTVSSHQDVNASGSTYVAYLWAGGFATTTTNTGSVRFPGSGNYLTVPSHSDLAFGTGDFTVECWAWTNQWSGYTPIMTQNSGGLQIGVQGGGMMVRVGFNSTTFINATKPLNTHQWVHIAVTRSGGKIRLFYDGVKQREVACTQSFSQAATTIGYETNGNFEGQLSNFRILKGTALYENNFRVPKEPLTNITNTKLLCCNDKDSVTGATVTPATITETGSLSNYNFKGTQGTPFLDTGANLFGEAGDEEIVKHGAYMGNNNQDGPWINCGWEPALVMIKRAEESTNSDWIWMDSMRGMHTERNDAEHNDKFLAMNEADSEDDINAIDIQPTGFKIVSTDDRVNDGDDWYVWTAIRRPDGFVGKPPDAATDMFNIDTGNGSSSIPTFNTNFIPDMAIYRQINATSNFFLGTRLTRNDELRCNANNQASSAGDSMVWDCSYNDKGWSKNSSFGSNHLSWMWGRNKGFDVVTYPGTGNAGREVPHGLGVVPEMIWCKMRDHPDKWHIYHKGLNGGSSPQDHVIKLDSTDGDSNTANFWNDTAPTVRGFTIGSDGGINDSSRDYLALLWASVSGKSAVGYYTGTGSSQTITLGFQPRFVIVKNTTDDGHGWFVFDTTRGWGSGADPFLRLNESHVSGGGYDHDYGAPTSTGISITSADAGMNGSGKNYIYYAHA